MKNDYDVVIAGAGPAGSSAAYFSKLFDKSNTKRILLIESLKGKKFIRYHQMCGEVVSKYIKNDLPGIKITDFTENKINRTVEYWGNKIEIQDKILGHVINRPKLLLNIIKQFKKRDGTFLEDKLISYKEEKEKIKLKLKDHGTINTKYLIIGTGPNTLRRDKVHNIKGDVFRSVLYQILVKNYQLEKDCIKFYYDEKYKENYKWIFPYKNMVKIGIPFENKEELNSYEKFEIIRRDVKTVCCGILKNYNQNNILFVGDAAFQNNPLTKGGIRSAINAGRIAAESLLKYDNPSRYDLMWKKSGFYNEPYLYACKKLRKMKNKELAYHAKPLKYFPLTLPLIPIKFGKYMSLYKTYFSSKKYGW